jgi:hypothetical protein
VRPAALQDGDRLPGDPLPCKVSPIQWPTRVTLSTFRIHHNQIVNSPELLPIVDELRTSLPREVVKILVSSSPIHPSPLLIHLFKDETGFNLAALKFLQMQIEERDAVKLFRNVDSIEAEKAAKKSRKKKRVKDTAVLRTLG